METKENSESSQGKQYSQININSPIKPIVIPSINELPLLRDTYRKNEIIVTFDENPSEADIQKKKDFFHEKGVGDIKITKCGNCDLPVQLWSAEGIDTIISAQSIPAPLPPKVTPAGSGYSLNFLSKIPPLNWQKANHHTAVQPKKSRKAVVTIAVLDTGIDPYIVEPGYTSNNKKNEPGSECIYNFGNGWNFVADNADIEDDNPGRHGSLVTQFIINQFKNSKKTVKIIPLKTHDLNGDGDLFKIFCAVYYAIAAGAKIINASWGFYYYMNSFDNQFQSLINNLNKKGVLLVTAAGNKIPADDLIAEKFYKAINHVNPTPVQLRDLDIHPFLPACFSRDENNLVTVTTTFGNKVSPNENYSNVFVDMSVEADESKPDDFYFKVPFKQSSGDAIVNGSSFATAIASGVIGANCNKKLYKKNAVDKNAFIAELVPSFCSNNDGLIDKIRNGICIEKVEGA